MYVAQVLLITGLNRKFGISDGWFTIGDSLIITVLGQVVCFFMKCYTSVIVLHCKLFSRIVTFFHFISSKTEKKGKVIGENLCEIPRCWKGERNIRYKDVETSPLWTRFKILRGNLEERGHYLLVVGLGCYKW